MDCFYAGNWINKCYATQQTYLPEFSSNLVTALAGLEVYNLSHDEAISEEVVRF